jgi:hypothetical protein
MENFGFRPKYATKTTQRIRKAPSMPGQGPEGCVGKTGLSTESLAYIVFCACFFDKTAGNPKFCILHFDLLVWLRPVAGLKNLFKMIVARFAKQATTFQSSFDLFQSVSNIRIGRRDFLE